MEGKDGPGEAPPALSHECGPGVDRLVAAVLLSTPAPSRALTGDLRGCVTDPRSWPPEMGRHPPALPPVALVLEANKLSLLGLLGDAPADAMLHWASSRMRASAAISTTAGRGPRNAIELRFQPSGTSEEVRQTIALEESVTYGKASRAWFACPGVRGLECGRRVMKLYLRPGGREFACRQCQGLSYRRPWRRQAAPPDVRPALLLAGFSPCEAGPA